MSWVTPSIGRRWEPVTCCYCGRRSPRDAAAFLAAGWQARSGYPVQYRCRRCRQRQEQTAA